MLPVWPIHATGFIRRMTVVSTVEHSDEPTMIVLPPEEALRQARPLPSRERLVIEDVPLEDWTTFREALTEA